MEAQKNFWIFQANPAFYDLQGALASLKQIVFTANQKSEQMGIGDEVFFWESGAEGGLAGTGEIIDGPKLMSEPEEEKPFLKSEKLIDPALRVVIKIGKTLSASIGKSIFQQHPLLKHLSIFKMPQGTNFLLSRAEGYSLRAAIDGNTSPSIYKVIPGQGKKFWKDCLDEGFICAGWGGSGDLSSFADYELFREYYDSIFQHDSEFSQNLQANMLWTFRNLKAGDILVASSGGKEVLGIGIVQKDGYKFMESRPEYKQTVAVAWDTTYAKKVAKTMGRLTINKVTQEKLAAIIGNEILPPPPPVTGTFSKLMSTLKEKGYYFSSEVVANYLLALQTKRFVIFSGISGTGKTQLARLVAEHFEPSEKKLDSHKLSVVYRTHPSFFKIGMKIKKGLITGELANFIRTHWKEKEYEWGNPPKITIIFPDGETQQTAYVEMKTNFFEVRFNEEFKKWLKKNIGMGEDFLIEFLTPENSDGQLRLQFVFDHRIVDDRVFLNGSNMAIVAVRPDWTDNRGLLGYYNPITKQYVSTPLIDFVLRAQTYPGNPFFLILDEMNLARVEHYFSDFLSCLESGQLIHLHDDESIEEGQDEQGKAIPRFLTIPDNLFITGTVNIDETTYMFSPKVLDRAFTIELSEVDFEAAVSSDSPADSFRLDKLNDAIRFARKPEMDDYRMLAEVEDTLTADIQLLNSLLAKYNRHFGYRVAWEMARFVGLANEQCPDGACFDAMDLAILQKVLPKFHGTQAELESALGDLFNFCVNNSSSGSGEAATLFTDWHVRDGALVRKGATDDGIEEPVYARSALKLWRMLDRLQRQGFTSFIE